MKVIARSYDNDDFSFRTAVEVYASELPNLIRSIYRLLEVNELSVRITPDDTFIIFYNDTRPLSAGKKVAPKISEHQKEIEDMMSRFVRL